MGIQCIVSLTSSFAFICPQGSSSGQASELTDVRLAHVWKRQSKVLIAGYNMRSSDWP